MALIFEWDENKAKDNETKHGVSFKEAKTVFNDPFAITIFDPDHSVDEDRFLDLGLSKNGRLLIVSYTDRGDIIRLISSREAIVWSDETMKSDDELRSEYDFSGGVRGKHYRKYRQGNTVKIEKADGSIEEHRFTSEDGSVMLDPDVKQHFPDSESVNNALRSLIKSS